MQSHYFTLELGDVTIYTVYSILWDYHDTVSYHNRGSRMAKKNSEEDTHVPFPVQPVWSFLNMASVQSYVWAPDFSITVAATTGVAIQAKCSASALMEIQPVYHDQKNTSHDVPGFLQSCKREFVCPTGGRREARTMTYSLKPWFSHWGVTEGCMTDRRYQTVHNMSDRDESIQWDVGTLPPLCTHAHSF